MDEVTPRNPTRRPWRRRVLTLLLALLVACGGYGGYVAIRAAQPVALPAPGGPHPVGRSIVEWTDHDRADPLAPQPGMPRNLSVWLWYPASPGPGASPAPYAPGAWRGLHFGGLAGLGETGFDAVDDHAFADVPVAAGRFPLVVLAPGMGFSAPQYTTLAVSLASHGYVVAGFTPTYSANLTVLDGQSVPATEAGNPPALGSEDPRTRPDADRLAGIWAADARFVASRAAALDGSGRFAGHIDPATVYLGHSFGGATALEACRTDPRCAGAADLDGTQFGTVVHAGLAKPMLLIGGQNSCVTGTCHPADPGEQDALDAARTLLTATTGPVWCYQVNGAEHFNFSDYGAYYLAEPLRFTLALGSIDGATALTITDDFVTAFADHVTRGRPEPLLTDRAPRPEVTVLRTAP